MGDVVDFEQRSGVMAGQRRIAVYWRDRCKTIARELSEWQQIASLYQQALVEVITSGADSKSIENATQLLIKTGVRK